MSAVVCMADASAVHVYSLMARLNDQRLEGGAFCDIMLRVGTRILPSHSCVLSACSPFFQELIRCHRPVAPHLADHPQEIELELPSDDDDGTAELLDAESDAGVVADLLDYMYTGKIELKDDSLHVVVQLAQAFALHDLTALIRTYVNGPDANGAPLDFDSAPGVLLDSMERRRRRRRKLQRRRKVKVASSSLAGAEVSTTTVSETLDALRILHEENPGASEGVEKIATSEGQLDDPDYELDEDFEDDEDDDDDEDDGPDGVDDGVSRRQHCSLRPLVKRRKSNRLSDEPYECRHCPFSSSELKAIREHKLLHPGRSYKCIACDYHTGLASKLLGHMETAEHPQHECSLCGFSLDGGDGAEGPDDRETLRLHLERHGADTRNPFFCALCDFRCRTRGNLNMHVASKHSAERPFVCHYCGKGFKWSASLQIHLQTHQGKGFLCDQCGFRTAYKHHLKMHKRIHNGGMFVCHEEGCGFQSICKQKLERHITTAHFSTATSSAGPGRRTTRVPRAPRSLPAQPTLSHAPELLPTNYVATYY